jgi:DNA-binding CsgD family transcriptional regulator
MNQQDRFASIIELIYGAVEQPSSWNGVLKQISEYSHSTHSFFTERKSVNGEPINFYEAGFSNNYFDKYGDYFYQVDIWSKNLALYTPNQFHESHKVCDDSQFLNSEIYCDFAKPEGIRHSIGLFLGDPYSDHTTEMAFMRSHDQTHYEKETVNQVNRFIPHIQQVQNLARRLYKLESRNQTIEELLNQLDEAVFLCDKNLKVEYTNRTAQDLLQHSKLFSGRQEYLQLRDKADAEILEALVLDATNIKSHINTFTKRHVIFFDGKSPFLVTVSPRHRKNEILFGQQPEFGAKVSFLPVDSRKLPPEAELVAIYGITMAEAEVMRLLCTGMSSDDIAQKRETSLKTCRQQIKSCMHKLGCTRQVELVIKVLGQCLI